MENLHDLIKKASIVSFDLFDTLIVQLYREPTDLFVHLEQHFQLPGFHEARIAAERAARAVAAQQEKEVYTLDDIYCELHSAYQEMKQQEIKLELLMCRADPFMKDLFDYALEQGIPVFLCSDTYLPQMVIEQILDHAGYQNYKGLLLSSGTKQTKETGGMYQDLIVQAGVSADQILYIGNCHHENYEMARKAGMQTYHYETAYRTCGQNLNSAYFALLNRYADQDVSISILEGLISLRGAHRQGEDYWENFGYKYFGILAYGYAKWLEKRLNSLGISRVYFMSRNSYIVKQVFDTLFPHFESHEIYGSRRIFLFAAMRKYCDIKADLIGSNVKGITFAQFWDRLSLENDYFYALYLKAFPNQEKVILNDKDLRDLDRFMEEHVSFILDEGAKERTILEDYFKELGIFHMPSAVIDLSSKGAILKEFERVCRQLEHKAELMGFWWDSSCKWKTYLLNHGGLTKERNIRIDPDDSFTNQVLEFVFSAPSDSVLKLQREDETILPAYQINNIYEADHINISHRIISGVMDFVRDMQEIECEFPISISTEAALVPVEYISKFISREDQSRIEQALIAPTNGLGNGYRPIFRQGRPVVGIVNPWPQDVSAEAEVITRLKRTAEENQIDCVLLDSFGRILDDYQKVTDQFICEEDLSFVITTHYECPKVLNTFYYNPLWNPPEIPLNLDDYTPRVANQFLMNDDFLIYDSGGMANHLRGVLMNCPRTLEGASSLTASFPASAALPPKLDNPVMFYCGMNWEVMFSGPGRHEGLFKLLDNTGKVEFFGPERVDAWGGLKPWEGYRCYQRMIPFDGFSILKEINRCGVCLVLSSDTHRRAGAATNRLYEACAAGAVIISDDNEFVLRYFKDAALFITFNKNNPKDTFRQIMEKYEWIIDHPKEALQLAENAQRIFEEIFTLDVQLNQILKNHPARFVQISQDLYARDDLEKVLVTFVLNTLDKNEARLKLDRVFQNIHGQLYKNIELAIAVDQALASEITDYCQTHCACANVVSMVLFDKKEIRTLTDGEAVRKLQKTVAHDCYINTTAEEFWFYDHITSLVRALTEQECMGAYSGSAFEDIDGFRRVNFFDTLNTSYLYHMSKPDHPLVAGQFMFRADSHGWLPDYLFENLDGKEHIAYAGVTLYRHGAKLAFTKRMSLCYSDKTEDKRCAVISDIMQYRFIRDLYRFYIPEQVGTVQSASPALSTSLDKKNLTDLLLFMPIKTYIRLRYYRFQMRRRKTGSLKYKKYSSKYDACLEQYRQFWNI